ncbi:ABC transporter ATP-binding protein [Agrobacterium salinitolerans]|uniref:ABC transporter ATP-binding protein n=1 Tax=Agrobacterium salinitolerans TaxID=1183413 RepID=UPI001572E542|nr:ABC transporter ATP-binding protein [Agrobacterium salinitolerans]NTA40254.1 ABC transporter ATP-binding protein [Agrobacterium salinitolerans]
MGDAPLLSLKGLSAFYGDFQALFDVDLDIGGGEVAAMVGANGAGKSTLMQSLAGLVTVKAGSIHLSGEDITHIAAHHRVDLGIALVPEGRRLFVSLTVEENLLIGARSGRPGPWNLGAIYRLFPMLAERRKAAVTTLSGGQQQMVAIGRALMSNPDLLLCDELSLGLAPIVVREIYLALRSIVRDGLSAIVVEQDIQQATQIADRLYCMRQGRIVLGGAPHQFSRQDIAASYFGV